MRTKLALIYLFILSISAQSIAEQAPYRGPVGGSRSKEANQKLFAQYCTGTADSTDIPGVNYANPEIIAAAAQMSKVKDLSYYFYPPVVFAYGLVKSFKKEADGTKTVTYNDVPSDAAPGITPGGHAFLVQLCGEFRDRATMIREKVRWLTNLYKLPVDAQKPIDPSKNIWAQLSAESMQPFSEFSAALWLLKQLHIQKETGLTFKIGNYEVDRPIEPQSICETKYILTKYISAPEYVGAIGQTKLRTYLATFKGTADDGKVYTTATYEKDYLGGLADFESKVCTKEDKDYFYDYRGDKNFKHNSPESNGMIWTANSVASHCKTTSKAKEGDKFIKDEDCQNYFREPFSSRWNSARAGLASWLFRDSSFDTSFRNPQVKIITYQHLNGKFEPFKFGLAGSESLDKFLGMWSSEKEALWLRPDIGFNKITGLDKHSTYNIDLTYERLRDAVNRHTNWYQSAFDDGMGFKMEQVYSPFVASSHVIAASMGFATGMDGRRAWMFIFKVKRSNIRNTTTISKQVPVNFDFNWFDETSLGTEAGVFAKRERAMDKLGTALEGEFDSILYLHNLSGNTVISDEPTPTPTPVVSQPVVSPTPSATPDSTPLPQ